MTRTTEDRLRRRKRWVLVALLATFSIGISGCDIPLLSGCSDPVKSQQRDDEEAAREAASTPITGSWTAEGASATALPYFGLGLLDRTPLVPGVDSTNLFADLRAANSEKGSVPADDEGTSRTFTLEWSLDADVDRDGNVEGTLSYTSVQKLSNATYGEYSTVTETLRAKVTGTATRDSVQLTATGAGPMEQTYVAALNKQPDVTQKSFVWTYKGTQ